jgi:hypothetical protein
LQRVTSTPTCCPGQHYHSAAKRSEDSATVSTSIKQFLSDIIWLKLYMFAMATRNEMQTVPAGAEAGHLMRQSNTQTKTHGSHLCKGCPSKQELFLQWLGSR